MKRCYSLTASAAVLLWSLAPAQAAPKMKGASPSTEAQATLEQIDVASATIAEIAFKLNDLAKSVPDPKAQIAGLDELKTDINKVGSELQSLEAERDSLSEWESKALDQTLPLMQDVAAHAEKAFQTYNANQARLFATSYLDDTDRISKDADQVSTLLRDYLKLAKTREKESRIEQSLEETH